MIKIHEVDFAAVGDKFRQFLDQPQRPRRKATRSSSNSRRDCFDDAIFRITVLKKAGQRISLLNIAAKLLGDHPWCGMSMAELSDAVGRLVIARGGSIA